MDDELIERKFRFVDDCYEHLEKRVEALEGGHADRKDDRQHAAGMRLNWIVVGLFAIELVIGIAQIVWTYRHA